jgi:hypothetical protein
MVKLRVAARVVAENDYNDAQSSPRSERKFLVVVRNPEDWLVGQLAVEVQNTYKRIYKQYVCSGCAKQEEVTDLLQ